MATTTKFPKGLSIGGQKGGDTTIAGVMGVIRGSFDPTSSSQVSLGTLPRGAVPIMVASYGGATGGTNPTVDIGTTGDDDGYANELDADGVAITNGGALMNTQITADTEVFGKVGASAATGGATSVAIFYVMEDI
jgi:hypothetical protein